MDRSPAVTHFPAVHMAQIDRRTFLKGVAAASAASTGVAVAHASPITMLTGVTRAAESAPAWTDAPCVFCDVGCGLRVHAERGQVVAVRGNTTSPVSSGLACARGYYAPHALYARDRLTTALVRRGRALEPVPLADALDLVAQRLRTTLATHGKQSVALYGSGRWSIPDAYLATKLFKGVLGTDNVDGAARLDTASATTARALAFGDDASIGCYDDVEHANVFVIWDTNLAESAPVLFSRLLARRQRDPAVRIVEVATRMTRTSYAADRTLLHVPRGTGWIANAICQEIVERRWTDEPFLERHATFRRGVTDGGARDDAAPLLDEGDGRTISRADFVSFLATVTPEHAERACGLAAASIRWLASLYGDRSLKVTSIWGADVNAHSHGTWLNNQLHNIHLLVGKVASPGNGTIALGGQPDGSSAVHHAGAMTGRLPRGTVMNADDRRRAAGIWNVPVEQIAATPGLDAIAMFRALDRGDVRFLWVQSSDPLATLPNVDRYRRAAAKDDRFLVVSDCYPTATTAMADVVLPSALWVESEGVIANAERRLQQVSAVVSPPGDATSDGWQVIEIARRLGHAGRFPSQRRSYASEAWAEFRRFHEDAGRALPTWAALRAQPGVIWPVVNGESTRWRYNTATDPRADRTRGAFDFHGFPDGRARLWLRPNEAPAESPDADFPLWLETGAVLEHGDTGTLTQRVPALHDALPRAYAELHRDDARQLGIREGDRVRVVSRRGALELEARIDYRSQPARGVIFVPSFDVAHPVARLMPDVTCPLSGQPELGACAVRVVRLGSPGAS